MDSSTVDEVLVACALRFDGYRYEQWSGRKLVDLVETFETTFRLDDDERANHAAFFALQRFLYKWGGEQLGPDARERQAFAFLFLHLYRLEIDPSDAMEGYDKAWDAMDRKLVEDVAAHLRGRLVGARPARRKRKSGSD